MRYGLIFILTTLCLLSACSSDKNKADAYGNFEATEVIVSAETTGKILSMDFNEGDRVNIGAKLGMIDTVQLQLKKEQIIASIGALGAKTQDVQVQLNVLDRKRDNIIREKNRLDRLFKDSAATRKQIDDINGDLDVIDKQIVANKSSLNSGNRGILSEKSPLAVQIRQINDQLAKSYILAPISGTILTKYAESGEFAAIGKPLFKVANLEELTLKVYLSAKQLSQIKLGQDIKIGIDYGNSMKFYTGKVYWISDKAEFTPKIVQTKEERVNLVYAVKIRVINDGYLKIGMPAEIYFN